MLNKFLAKLAVWLLRNKKLERESKSKVMAALLDNVGALPLRSTIIFDNQGTILLNGKPLELEQAISFRESARIMQDSFARKLINEQLKYLAIQYGVHNGLTPDMIIFSKAALWMIDEENKLLNQIIEE